MMSDYKDLEGILFFDCERPLDDIEWQNNNPNEGEAFNEMGIMECTQEENYEQAIKYFKKAIELGNFNSMINGFTALWTEQRYEDAVKWLKKMNGLGFKNPKCLWNEAILYYYGDTLRGNPLNYDRGMTKILMESIIKDCASYIEYRATIEKAYGFLILHGLSDNEHELFLKYKQWKNEIRLNELSTQKTIVEDITKAWNQLNPELIIRHLSHNFRYDSQWNFDTLGYDEYVDYIRGKFQNIDNSHIQITARTINDLLNDGFMTEIIQSNNGEERKAYFRIKIEEDKIIKGDLCMF